MQTETLRIPIRHLCRTAFIWLLFAAAMYVHNDVSLPIFLLICMGLHLIWLFRLRLEISSTALTRISLFSRRTIRKNQIAGVYRRNAWNRLGHVTMTLVGKGIVLPVRIHGRFYGQPAFMDWITDLPDCKSPKPYHRNS